MAVRMVPRVDLRDERRQASGQATIDVMEQRLQAWAAWRRGGRQSAGYPTKCVLHPSWMPPSPGTIPAPLQVLSGSTAMEQQMDRDIGALSERLRSTLAAVYLMRAPVAEQAQVLRCQPSTVKARVATAKRLLARMADRHAG